MKLCAVHKKNHSQAGFSLIEILAVFAIIGVLAAIAVPSMLVFVERGSQMNRTNIARTVYLAAQNQLTELRITKNLKAGLTREYYNLDNGKYIEKPDNELLDNKNVFTNLQSLGAYLPQDEIDQNKKYVHYISKAKGVTDPGDPVIQLLGPVILDKSILSSAILIEYNIRTGVVLSVFYGDTVSDGDSLLYTGTGNDSVYGTRGMGEGGYAYADARKQGYYGVENTGVLEDPFPSFIKVYDSYNPPNDASLTREYANMLCAEILIPKQHLNGVFNLLINGTAVETGVSFSELASVSKEENGISGALSAYALGTNSGTALLYRYDGGIEEDYARIFWVLDYVGGDMSGGSGSNAAHSIYTKYAYPFVHAGKTPPFSHGQNLRVGIQGGVSATSFTEAHPYFFTEHQGVYERNQYTVKSARHLYNVRYVPNANFRQRDDIVLDYGVSDVLSVRNFAPIPHFTGTYTAAYRASATEAHAGHVIRNLTINMPGTDDVGLFGRITGVADPLGAGESRASVVGLTLENPSVSGRFNVGSVCGSLNGFITGIYVRYTDAASGKTIGGDGNVGGIVGQNEGTLTDATFISPTVATHITGPIASSVGGLVGNHKSGALKRAQFLALAPKDADGKICPVIGSGSLSVPTGDNYLYYLSGAAKRPILEPVGYNTDNVNFPAIASGLGTAELYNTVVGSDWQRDLKSGQPLTYEEATDDRENTVYPYPYSGFSQNQIAVYPAWPIADGLGDVKLSNIAYYEKYQDNTYGLWFVADGHQNDGSLNSGKTIVESGYAIVLNEDLLAPHHFFVSTNGSSWERIAKMEFVSDNTQFAIAAKKHAAWADKADIWVCTLPLDELSSHAKTSAPLHMMYTISDTGTQPQPIDGYLQPLFAKGVYKVTNPAEFFIRTPWQMRNIDTLTGTTNYTDGKTFTQERDLDYLNTGVGVNVSAAPTNRPTTLNGPAIGGEFCGTYQGKNQSRAIRNVEIKTDTGNASLFAINKGTIKNIALMDSEINSLRASAAGIAEINDSKIENCKVTRSTASASMTISGSMEMCGIALTNAGSIAGTSVENTTITSNNSAAAGIAGTNSGSITNTSVRDSSVISQNTAAAGIAVTNENNGKISGGGISGTTVTGHGAVGGIAAENFGSISGISVTAASTITSSDNSVGGVAKENNGSIVNATVQDSTITTPSNSAAGIATYNNGAGRIENCTVANVTVSGYATSGGAARTNLGFISKTNVRGSRITSSNDSAGGIAGFNAVDGLAAGRIEDCTAVSVTVSGSKMVGGAAGENQIGTAMSETIPIATIKRTTVETAVIRGDNSVGSDPVGIGGIAGNNVGIVEDCMVITAELLNGAKNIGGIAGQNTGSVLRSGVEYSTIAGNNSSVGGVVGYNSGAVEDVFFLSMASPTHSIRAVSDSGGGIAGINAGTVTRALYLAPAPRSGTGSDSIIYPIVRDSGANGQYAGVECFYLSGYRYSLNEGKDWFPTESELDPDDESARDYYRYNRSTPKGGGMGLVTSFIAKNWLSFAYDADFDEWLQPGKGYPYPILHNGMMTAPAHWPITDSPVRPDQLDRESWAETLPTSNRAQNLNFINGDFDAELMNPDGSGTTFQSTDGNYWSRVAVYPNGPLVRSDDNYSASNLSTNNSFWRYFHHTWVQGWNTRPVGTTDKPIDRVNSIEFQRPNTDASNGRVRTNYNGGMDGVYAELNADAQGTLYQIAPTIPGTELYYSFYHARRTHNSTSGYQRMNFYLSDMVDKAGVWDYKNGTTPTIIRPCITPRDNAAGTKKTRESVVYGETQNNDAENVTVGSVDFYNPKTKAIQNAYLVDVWVCTDGNSTPNAGDGYGITFWSTSSLAVQASGTNTRIPTNGITKAQYESGTWTWLTSARNNVIGYWDVKHFNNNYSEWKQYYGLYTIPEGQISTEFAFESASIRNPMQGNYLDGITFQSPGFLSIDKYVRDAKTGADVTFVKPGDPLTVDLAVKNWGEVTVNNIVIQDRISPFEAYIDYAGGVTVKRGSNDTQITGAKIAPPNSTNNYILTIELPESVELKTDDVLLISFGINVKNEVSNEVSTLLYYFRNQATVSYYDAAYRGYSHTNSLSKAKGNASGPGPVWVFIDPIKLTKTVTLEEGNLSDPLINGPFKVELTIENAIDGGDPMETTGLVSDAIPAGFVISDYGTLPEGSVTDNGTRISISGADLSEETLTLKYYYTLNYVGDGYGVSYTSASAGSADYKYLCYDEKGVRLSVNLLFPQPVVGITVKTEPVTRMISANGTHMLNIIGDSLSNKLADDNYDVSPVVMLTDEHGEPVSKNVNGDYQINHADFTATLVKSTNQLQFTPTASGQQHTLYYKIDLTATKEGGTPDKFELSSEPAKVIVTVTDADILVYFEKYDDDSYGFYAGDTAPVPQPLNNGKAIVGSGYGVLSLSDSKVAQLNGESLALTPESCNDAWLYKLETDTVEDTSLLEVSFGGDGNDEDAEPMEVLGKIHPNFAKAVYPAAATIADRFAIRTPEHMRNISELAENSNTSDVSFVQEHDLDFSGFSVPVATGGTTAAPADETEAVLPDSVVTGVFEGTFAVATSGTTADGEDIYYTISNVTIESGEDNIGLFSQNSGTITGITLRPDTRIIGGNNVGGIVGHNLPGGKIEGCIVEGELDAENHVTYNGMHIEGSENVGGIAGWNDGDILGCTVRNTTQTIKGYDYVGGIAGWNGENGTILEATVSNIKLEATGGSNCHELVGYNENSDEDAVSGDGDDNVTCLTETEQGEESEASKASEASSEPEPSGDSESGSEPPDAKEPEEPEGVQETDESDESEEPGESEVDSESQDAKEPEEPEDMQEADESDTPEEPADSGEPEDSGESEAAGAETHLFVGGYSPQ